MRNRPLIAPVVLLILTAIFVSSSVIAGPPVDQLEAETGSLDWNTIEAGDVLLVSVWELYAPGELTQMTVQADRKGLLSLPLLPVIETDGKTVRELEDAIQKSLLDEGILRSAIVTVATVRKGTPDELVPLAPGDVLLYTLDQRTGAVVAIQVDDDSHIRLFTGLESVSVEGHSLRELEAALAPTLEGSDLISGRVFLRRGSRVEDRIE